MRPPSQPGGPAQTLSPLPGGRGLATCRTVWKTQKESNFEILFMIETLLNILDIFRAWPLLPHPLSQPVLNSFKGSIFCCDMDTLLYSTFTWNRFCGQRTLSFSFPDTQLLTLGFLPKLFLTCTWYHPMVAQARSLAFVLDQHLGFISPSKSISHPGPVLLQKYFHPLLPSSHPLAWPLWLPCSPPAPPILAPPSSQDKL